MAARWRCLFVLSFALTGCQNAAIQLTDPPALLSLPVVLPSLASVLSVDVSASFPDLQAALEERVPRTLEQETTAVCMTFSFQKRCGAYRYIIERKAFKVLAGGTPDTLRVETEVQLDGVVSDSSGGAYGTSGGKGSVVNALVDLDVHMVVDPNGCPRVTVASSYRLIGQPYIEFSPYLKVSLENLANTAFTKFEQRFSPVLNNLVSCVQFKSLLEPYWKTHAWPFQAGEHGTLFASMTPLTMASSDLVVGDGEARLALSVGGSTSVAPAAGTMAGAPLPALLKTGFQPGRVSLNTPLSIPYAQVEDYIREATRQQPFDVSLFAGEHASVTIRDVKVYPAGARLVIGIQFDAKAPGRLFDVAGWLYVIGTPVIDTDRDEGHLEDVQFVTHLDNPLWTWTAELFPGQVQNKLRALSRMNLGPRLQQRAEDLARLVDDQTRDGPLRIQFLHPKLSLKRVVASDTLLVVTNFEAAVEARLQLSGFVAH